MPDDALATVARWLRCPHCHQPLVLRERSLVCPAGHGFDVARQGYVNLLGRAAPRHADTARMVQARSRFLEGGWYQPIRQALAGRTADAQRILEVGAGAGYYLAGCLGAGAWGLATDISAAACRRAARAHPRQAAVVADTWAGLPLADGAVDVILCVFAPRNPAEFRRVLAPGGRVLVVVPEPGHLAALRRRDQLLEVAPDKTGHLRQAFHDWRATDETVIREPLDLDAAGATDLVQMGPNAFHDSRTVDAIQTDMWVRLIEFSP